MSEEINKTIAEWMGFRVFRPSEIKMRSNWDKECYGIDKGLYILPKKKRPQTHMIDAIPLPRFTDSIDAAYRAEKQAVELFGDDYPFELIQVLDPNDEFEDDGVTFCRVITATSQQRAEAVYNLITKKTALITPGATVSQHTAAESMEGIVLTN